MMADKASPTRAILDKRPVVEIGSGRCLLGSVGMRVIPRHSGHRPADGQASPKAADNCTQNEECAVPDYLVCSYACENKSFTSMSKFEKRGLSVATKLSRQVSEEPAQGAWRAESGASSQRVFVFLFCGTLLEITSRRRFLINKI